MTTNRSLRGLLHRATHRIPAVPAHADQPAGHHGTTVHGHPGRRGGPSPNRGRNARPPRFMPAWQRRIAAFFGQER
jgi:hypothetical protein